MEAAAIFTIAAMHGVRAGCLLTVSDTIGEEIVQDQRRGTAKRRGQHDGTGARHPQRLKLVALLWGRGAGKGRASELDSGRLSDDPQRVGDTGRSPAFACREWPGTEASGTPSWWSSAPRRRPTWSSPCRPRPPRPPPLPARTRGWSSSSSTLMSRPAAGTAGHPHRGERGGSARHGASCCSWRGARRSRSGSTPTSRPGSVAQAWTCRSRW